jgi:hypothetical protein
VTDARWCATTMAAPIMPTSTSIMGAMNADRLFRRLDRKRKFPAAPAPSKGEAGLPASPEVVTPPEQVIANSLGD